MSVDASSFSIKLETMHGERSRCPVMYSMLIKHALLAYRTLARWPTQKLAVPQEASYPSLVPTTQEILELEFYHVQ